MELILTKGFAAFIHKFVCHNFKCRKKSCKYLLTRCYPMTLFFTDMASPRNHQKIFFKLFQVPTNEQREERNKFNLKH